MKKETLLKRLIKKVLFPTTIIGFILFNLGFGLLFYVFYNHLEDTILAYTSYGLSFYALIIFSIWFYRICRQSKAAFKKSKLFYFYQKHSLLVTKGSLYFSLIFNLLFGILKLGIGFYYNSWWFITFAIYYLLLCFMRVSLVKNINNHEKAYQKLKHTGIILLFLNVILIGIIVIIIKQDQIIHYGGFLIYLIALYDFYLIISAINKVMKYRKKHNPIIASSKCINLTVAMISMVSLEVAMVYQFGNNDTHFKLVMTSCMGFAICFINSTMALYMVFVANRNLKA